MTKPVLRRLVLHAVEDGRRDVPAFELTVGDIARLRWEEDTGEVHSMWVAELHRRQGIMRALWEQAVPLGIKHSRWRTDDGDAFARAVGGELPTRLHP